MYVQLQVCARDGEKDGTKKMCMKQVTFNLVYPVQSAHSQEEAETS